MHAVRQMLPFTTDVDCSVFCASVCVLLTKTAEPIEMPFGGLALVGPRNHVLYQGQDPSSVAMGNFEGCLAH